LIEFCKFLQENEAKRVRAERRKKEEDEVKFIKFKLITGCHR